MSQLFKYEIRASLRFTYNFMRNKECQKGAGKLGVVNTNNKCI